MSTLEQQFESEVSTQTSPSPNLFFETMNAYQRTAALKAAIDLDLFTLIGATSSTVPQLAEGLNSPERGVQALCDALVVLGFLGKYLDHPEALYNLTHDSAMFLDKKSPRYLGSATVFMGSPVFSEAFRDLAAVVRAGGPVEAGTRVDREVSVWVDFARGMGPILFPVAEGVAGLLKLKPGAKVLDVSASHGLFGIAVAQHNPSAKIVALDFPSVLAVTRANAERFGVSGRHTVIAGDALEVPFGEGYDAVLVPNLLHHWDRQTILTFLRKVHAALAPGGQVVVVEFAPNDDRVSPPIPALFVLNMLALTAGGNAYTLSENLEMLATAGFVHCESYPLPPTPQTAIVANKG